MSLKGAVLVKDCQVIDDTWQWLMGDGDVIPGEGPIVVSLSLWQVYKDDLKQRMLGVYLDSDQSPALIADSIEQFQLIAINFPQLTDGRGFSYGRSLREQYGFQGELRAVGHFIIDQLFYLQRCGFNAFSFQDKAIAKQALHHLKPFTYTYQSILNEGKPLLSNVRRQ